MLRLAALSVALPAVAATSASTVGQWGDSIAAAIDNTVEEVMQTDALQSIINEQPYTLYEADGSVDAAVAAATVSQVIGARVEQLALLAAAAAAAHAAEDPALTDPALLPASQWAESPSAIYGTVDDALVYADVNATYSAWKIAPAGADAAEYVPSLLASGGAAMDPVFEAGAAADDAIAFQYYGSASGALRFFPAADWSDADYDPRLSDWFARAASGPKNVLLLLEHGAGTDLALLKAAAQNVLATISKDDYLLVVTYDASGPAESACFTGGTLVRGTGDNVAVLSALVDGLASGGGGTPDHDGAVAAAFAALDATVAAGLGAASACETVVLVLSGTGGSGGDTALATRDDAVVYSYNVGGGGDAAYLRGIACANSGVYHIVDDAAGAVDVGLYYEYLPVADDAVTVTYGKGLRPALLEAGNPDASLLTVAQSIWDEADGSLVGVVALDFTMYELKDTLESLHFQQSFPILVNSEGDTLYHPLQTQYKSLTLFDTGRDVGNYEYFDSWDTAVRPGLVGGETGQAELTVDRALEKGDAEFEGLDVESIDTTYFFQALPSYSSMSLAYAYAKNDLTRRVLRPSRFNATGLLFRDLNAYLDPQLAGYIPEEAVQFQPPALRELLNGSAIYNQDNCANSSGSAFANCKADAYCPECTGSCVCQPNRWLVNTVSTYPSTAYAPQCYDDPTTAASRELSVDVVEDIAAYINRNAYAVNGEPALLEKCRLLMQMNSKFFPTLLQAVADGRHNGTVWTYFGGAAGTIAGWPGNDWGNWYDPTRRPWYSRAIAYKGRYQHIISTPYIDSGGAGLMNTFAEAAWEQMDVDTGEIIVDRVFGVSGWDLLYPEMDAFASDTTVDIDGGCGTKTVYDARTTDAEPMCFLVDPAGLLLTHSDFLVSLEDAYEYVDQVAGNVGDWPVNNVFLGKKEPPLAQALLDAGFLVLRSDVLNEDGELLLSYYETNDDAIPADTGVLEGSASLDADGACYQPGATWKLTHVAKTNAYLIVVDGYERAANLDSCATVEAAGAEAVEFDTCAFSSAAASRARGSLWCPGSDRVTHARTLESRRASYAKCSPERYVDPSGGVGLALVVFVSVVWFVVLLLAAAVYALRERDIMRELSGGMNLFVLGVAPALCLSYLLALAGKPTDAGCALRPWHAGAAFAALLAPFFAKQLAVSQLTASNWRMTKFKPTTNEVLAVAGALAALLWIVALVWTAADPLRATYRDGEEDGELVVFVECDADSAGGFIAAFYALMFLAVLVGVKLSLANRDIRDCNKPRAVKLNFLFLGALLVPMIYGLDLDYNARYLLEAVGVTLATCSAVALVYLPKLMNLDKKVDDLASSPRSKEQVPSSASGPGSASGDPKHVELAEMPAGSRSSVPSKETVNPLLK